ncbi:MAG: hypothetical protein QNJ57_04485 [Flavobacteriaceae bacterium]|nr:hypothetical protein [Flavobacteriaceae bacterium]
MVFNYSSVLSVLLLFLVACSSDTPDMETNSEIPKIDFQLEDLNTTYAVDQPLFYRITSSSGFKNICFAPEDPELFYSCLSHGSSVFSADLNFSLDTPGLHDVTFYTDDPNVENEEKKVQLTISTENAIQLKSITLIDFPNKDGAWDPEFSDTSEERLADLVFGLLKTKSAIEFSDEVDYDQYLWHRSDILINQGSLTWLLTDKDLFLNQNTRLEIDFGDDDGNGIGEPIVDFPYSFTIDFKEYSTEKPSSIIFEDTDKGLKFMIDVEWF